MIDLLLACALHVAPTTMSAVIKVESQGNPIAINVNHLGRRLTPHSREEAADLAHEFIAKGYSVDLGLTQINSRNLQSLGLTVEMALDPCSNIRGGATILTDNYAAAARRYGEGQGALLAALSAYNTGSFERGFANGYVSKYLAGVEPARVILTGVKAKAEPSVLSPYTADTSVYSRGIINVRVN